MQLCWSAAMPFPVPVLLLSESPYEGNNTGDGTARWSRSEYISLAFCVSSVGTPRLESWVQPPGSYSSVSEGLSELEPHHSQRQGHLKGWECHKEPPVLSHSCEQTFGEQDVLRHLLSFICYFLSLRYVCILYCLQ